MAAGKLSAQTPGTIVKIKESGSYVDFLVLIHNYPASGRTLLLRKDIHSLRKFCSSSVAPDYTKSEIDPWLTGTYINYIDSEIKSQISPVTIQVSGNDGNSIDRTVFLLSNKELGAEWRLTDQLGSEIPYFTADTKRIAKYQNTATKYWCRNRNTSSTDYVVSINTSGRAANTTRADTSTGVRPAFTVPSGLFVQSDGALVVNTPPVISGSNGALGSFGESPPSYKYTVTDAQGGTVSVTEKVDSTVLRTYNVTLGNQNTLTVSADAWRKILNGSHTLTITAKDSQGATATRTQTFTKNVTSCSFVTAEAFPADAMPDRCIVNVQGKFPEGSTLKVEICNNGSDASPTWEDITQNALNNQKYFFTNKTKTASAWGVKLRATLSRGTASGDCYISSLGGNFQ